MLTDRLRSIAFALLTPFFFLRAGTLISAPALISGAGVIAVLLLVKLAAKMAGVWPVAAAFKLPRRERAYTTLLMATGLTFGSIAALFGLTHHLIDKTQYTELVTVVILSAFVPTVIAQQLFQPTVLDTEEEEALGEEDLTVNPRDRRPAWQQVAAMLTEAIQAGVLASGDELPSITEVSALQGIGTGVIRHALEALAADGLIIVRHGRSAVVAGEPGNDPRLSRRRPGPGHDCRLAGCHAHVCHPMKPSTIRGIHSILSGAFAAAQRWEWTDRNPAESAKPPTTIRRSIAATSPDDVAKVIAEARGRSAALGLYLWLVVVTGVRRGELCGLQLRDIDLDRGLVHVAFNYVVRGGQRVRKDTKTHQDRWLAIDPDTCALIANYLDEIRTQLAAVGVKLGDAAYLFSNDPAHSRPWNPDWVTHQIAAAAAAAGVKLDIKGGRHYTASQLLACGFDLRNTAARLGRSGGGATTLRHYADPVPEVDRRAAAYLAQLTARSTPSSPPP